MCYNEQKIVNKSVFYYVLAQLVILVIANLVLDVTWDYNAVIKLSLASIVFPVSNMASDLYAYLYGNRSALIGIHIALPFTVIVCYLFGDASVAIISTVVFYISQLVDLMLFSLLRNDDPTISRALNASIISTLLSQIVDTILFYSLIFVFIPPFEFHQYPVIYAFNDYAVKVLGQCCIWMICSRLLVLQKKH
jgi:uncharacterized PurR-regulated membrane protein YhhQ (DUF165 family)